MSQNLSRRELLQSIGLGAWAAGAMSFSWPMLGIAQDAKPAAALPTLNRFSRVVQEWFVDQVRQIESQILAEQSALKTKADAEAYVLKVQQKIRRCFGIGFRFECGLLGEDSRFDLSDLIDEPFLDDS